VVFDARPEDSAARETKELFEKVLTDEYGLSNVNVSKDDVLYYVTYTVNGESKKNQYPIELIDIMLNQINERPERYKNYPSED